MKPTGTIPPHFSASEDGQLMIGGYAAEELVAEAGGTPLFVYDNNIVGGQIARLKAAMPDGLALYYSVSANPYEPLLNFIGRYVEGFRIVSKGELERLKRADLAGIPMTFAGPGKRDDELDAGIAAGATISVESEGEARRTILAGERVGIRPKVAVRVNPPFGAPQSLRHRRRGRSFRRPRPDRGWSRLARTARLRRCAMPRRFGADRGAQGDYRLRR